MVGQPWGLTVSTLSLVILSHLAAACPTAKDVPFEHVWKTATVESHFQTTAIHDNATGREYTPLNAAAATSLAKLLHAQGHSIDVGIMQVNAANWPRLGLRLDNVFDPAVNVCAGMSVLADAYSIERRVSCRYNSGSPNCTRYADLIDRAVVPASAMSQVRPATVATASVNPFFRPGGGRLLTFNQIERTQQ